MLKDLSVSILLDFYANALTNKQREVVALYYNEDLSLSEIAEHVGISRQGVRDSIKRGEAMLYDLEEKLGMVKRFDKMRSSIDKVLLNVDSIELQNQKFCSSKEISNCVDDIRNIIATLLD